MSSRNSGDTPIYVVIGVTTMVGMMWATLGGGAAVVFFLILFFVFRFAARAR